MWLAYPFPNLQILTEGYDILSICIRVIILSIDVTRSRDHQPVNNNQRMRQHAVTNLFSCQMGLQIHAVILGMSDLIACIKLRKISTFIDPSLQYNVWHTHTHLHVILH